MTELKKGTIAMAAAYTWWGIMPLYWNVLSGASSFEIIAYRVAFSFISVLIFIAVARRRGIFSILKNRKMMLLILGGTLMLTINWTVYIYAISIGDYTQASMGYYINPIVSILLGMIFLKEKLTRWQAVALILVSIGVIYYIFSQDRVPLIALTLAVTFGLYGLYKKTIGLDSIQSLTIETGILFPVSLIVLWIVHTKTGILFTNGTILSDIFIILAGIVTLGPLLLFAEGAKRIPLTRVGFLQYIAPSLMLVSGLILRSKFNIHQLICFVFIWSGLAVYTISNIRKGKLAYAGENYT
jgi:chloramphenicol-sensitive protein RarD